MGALNLGWATMRSLRSAETAEGFALIAASEFWLMDSSRRFYSLKRERLKMRLGGH